MGFDGISHPVPHEKLACASIHVLPTDVGSFVECSLVAPGDCCQPITSTLFGSVCTYGLLK